MSARASLELTAAVRRRIVAQARRARPLECCGFLVGRGRAVWCAVPMQNAEKSPVRYRIADRAHIELRRVLRGFEPRLAILGVYHSHPAGDAWPSAADIAEAYYPEWAYVIVGLRGRPLVRAFHIRRGRVEAVALREPGRRRAVSSSLS